MGKCDKNVFTPAPERALLLSDSNNEWKPVSERKVTRRTETILIMDNLHLRTEAASCSLRRTYVMDNLLGFMNMLILLRLGMNCCAGRTFCWDDFPICL